VRLPIGDASEVWRIISARAVAALTAIREDVEGFTER
jgi:hypothetical protein